MKILSNRRYQGIKEDIKNMKYLVMEMQDTVDNLNFKCTTNKSIIELKDIRLANLTKELTKEREDYKKTVLDLGNKIVLERKESQSHINTLESEKKALKRELKGFKEKIKELEDQTRELNLRINNQAAELLKNRIQPTQIEYITKSKYRSNKEDK